MATPATTLKPPTGPASTNPSSSGRSRAARTPNARAIASRSTLLLLLPLSVVFIVGFVLPMIFIARYSFADTLGEGWNIAAFATVATTPQYLSLIGRTLLLALASTVLAAVISYPLALAAVRGPRRIIRNMFLIATTLPLLTSVVVKTFGWSVLLSGTGPVQGALDAIGFESVRLMFTPLGVIIGLTHTYFPFLALSLIAAIGAIDRRTEEAALSLGSHPFGVFWKVTFPQSLNGLASGAGLTFVMSMSALVTPQLLGGGRVTTIVTVIYQQATAGQDWPLASALGIVLLALTFLILSLQAWAVRRVLTK